MNIKQKLSLKFCFIVGTLFILFSISIYFFFSLHRSYLFKTRLKNRGITIAQLIDNVNIKDVNLLESINSNTKNALYFEGISIFSLDNNTIYNFGEKQFINAEILNEIKKERDQTFLFKNNEAVGFVFSGKTEQYKVVVSAFDQLGFDELKTLKFILFVGALLSIIVSYIAGWLFAGHALKPISKIVHDINNITASKLNIRLSEGKRQDEIEKLSITFNEMLDRVEKAFESQRGFVSNASHELRTPLTSMKGHIDVTLKREREVKDYIETLQLLSDEVENLNKISNNLLQLARATSFIDELKLSNVRVDDMLFLAREELCKMFPEYQANITFSVLPENELLLCVFGNEQLVKTAFLNIMENACKYSDNKTVEVNFIADAGKIELLFKDKGIGIPPSEMEKIFQPFYRGSNSVNYSGSGLGLSLTKKIIELHKGNIQISSTLNVGTEIRIVFPSITS